jgi:hypothetical protein
VSTEDQRHRRRLRFDEVADLDARVRPGTPEQVFADLPDFPFAPHDLDALPGTEGLRLHDLDEGPADGP